MNWHGLLYSKIFSHFRATYDLTTTIIYAWIGVEDKDPNSRSTYYYGNAIGDARKLYAMEALLGEGYEGIWCWNEIDPNPHGPAADILLAAFSKYLDSIYVTLMQQTWFKAYYDAITYSWDAASQTLIPDLSGVKAQFIKEEAKDHGKARESFGLFIRHFFSENSISAEALLAFKKTLKSYGDDIDITILNILKERKDILGTNSIDSLIGTYGDDTLIGWGGDDVLQAGYGNDTYIFKKGDGKDTIYDYGYGIDTIQFLDGITPEDIRANRNRDDLILSYSDQDKITIQNFFYDTYYKIEKLQFSDGTQLILEDKFKNLPFSGDELDNEIKGSKENDLIYGLDGNDSLCGEIGNDTLNGAIGNDVLQGGNGNDTYVFKKGDGKDTIYDCDYYDNNDTIQFLEGVLPEDIRATRNRYDLTTVRLN